MKRARSSPTLLIEELLELGLILPDRDNLHLDVDNYRQQREFLSGDLESRRRLCPDLFMVGSNAINDDDHFHLNLKMAPKLQQQFPLVPFETREDFRMFLDTPTFYLVNWLVELEGEDILGNDYRSLENSIVFFRICPGNPMGTFEVYSEEELTATFLQYNDFINPKWKPALFGPVDPQLNKKLTSFEIARIEKLLESLIPSYPPAEALLDVISGIRLGASFRHQTIDELKPVVDEETKEFLYLVLYIGMRMRGWSGEGTYPLKSLDTSGKVDDTTLIEMLVQLLKSSDHWLDLPLFNYIPPPKEYQPLVPIPSDFFEPSVDDDVFEQLLHDLLEQERDLEQLTLPMGEFQISTSHQQGFTIRDRAMIVLKNEDDYACIRLSSNWFLSTAWYYLDIYFGIRPFQIDDLAWIS